jgi:hypothetical protein
VVRDIYACTGFAGGPVIKDDAKAQLPNASFTSSFDDLDLDYWTCTSRKLAWYGCPATFYAI